MKIGINNIFTSFWFVIMFLCGGTLTYFSFDRNLFTSDLIFIAKFFVGLIVFMTIGILCYFLYKFRIIIIDNNIVSINPFWFKKEKIDLTKIKKLNLENFFAFRGIVYRRIEITDINGKLEINDLEFENFEKLTSEINLDRNKKKEIDLEQAKSNLSSLNFNVYILSGLLIFLVFNTIWNSGFHPIVLAFFTCIGILLYASIKRKIEYKRTIKNGLQHRV
ncbi:hypothetical protein HNV10_11490 [Winogradskyella litoriviva]|uniref:PH domain-containing protein n=1 Tax=Winogradskyella litoriviva TaxID=1220182 RepID=A0ABX2E605_9FLAO|nr:hypothetical protein [Winogradskyella litoriviva]NRD23870.1 hypothetical protein [Winogradskyella litoriviva]